MISNLLNGLLRSVWLVLVLGFANVAMASSAEPQPALRQHAKSVFVMVTMETPPVSGVVEAINETKQPEWANNIKQAIQKTGVFAELYAEPGADYTLKVAIKNVPVLAGWHFNLFSAMTLEMESEWTLVATLTDVVVMKKTIKTTHSDGASVMNALEKHQVTNRGLVAKNIADGLLAISLLTLD